MALAIQSHLAPKLKKEDCYNFSPSLGSYDLFYFEPYLLPTRSMRRRLLQSIMYRTAVMVIATSVVTDSVVR